MGTSYIQYPQSGGGSSSTGSSTGVPYSVGPIDTAPANAQGGFIGSFSFYQQSATATFPGLISSAAQVLSGVKTFSNGIVSSVTGLASLNLPLTGGTITGSISMSSSKISNVTDPTTAQEAATKNYVDTQLNAFQPLEAVAEASTIDYPGILAANVLTITATGAISVDGVTPSAGDRILLKNQATQAQNGVYVVTGVGSVGVSPVLTRAGDYNTAAEVNSGASIPVIGGSVNKFTTWIQTATVVTINVDSLVFTQYSANPQNVPITVGALNGAAASPNGAVIGSSSLYLQTATNVNPGIISSNTQNFSGIKNFERIGLNNTSGSSTLWITTSSASLSDPSLTIKAIPSLTGDLFQIFDSANSPQVIFDAGGNFKFFHNTLNTSRFDVRPSINTSSINSGTAARYTAFFSQSGNTAAGVGGGIALGGPNNVGTNTTYAAIWCTKDNVSAGDVSASLHLATKNNSTGNFQRAIDIDAGGNTTFAGTVAITGSVASKITIGMPASNTPYNLTLPVSQGSTSWVLQNSDGAGTLVWASVVTNPMTATGDIIVGSGSGVANRLAIGSNGFSLFVDPSAPNNISWQPNVIYKNRLVNAGLDYWQAAASGSNLTLVNVFTSQYTTADQFWIINPTVGSVVMKIDQQIPVLIGSKFGAKIAFSSYGSAPTPNDSTWFSGQMLSNLASSEFFGRKASVGIQIKSVNTETAANVAIITNTSETIAGYTVIASATVTINSATFTNVSLSNVNVGTAHGTAGIVGIKFSSQTVSSGSLVMNPSGLIFEQPVFNLGPVVMPFARQYSDTMAEFNSCLYFYEKSYDVGTAPGTITSTGATCYTYAAALPTYTTQFSVPKRTTPACSGYSPRSGAVGKFTNYTNPPGGGDQTINFTNQGTRNMTQNAASSATHNIGYHWVADARM